MLTPTETTEDYWVYHGKSSLVSSELKDIGKWMLFYPKSNLDFNVLPDGVKTALVEATMV